MLHLSESSYDSLEPLDFRSRPKTSSSEWFADYPYETKEVYGFRLKSRNIISATRKFTKNAQDKNPIIFKLSIMIIGTTDSTILAYWLMMRWNWV